MAGNNFSRFLQKQKRPKWTYKVERKKVAHATISCYQKGKDQLSVEIRTNWKLSCPTQYWNSLA